MASPQDSLALAALHLRAGKYFQVAAFVMLVYDHILTLPDEIERIWGKRFSGATILFLINRYATPLQFIVILDAFNDPIWTKTACKRFVAFEGGSTIGLVAVCQVIMMLRVYALYGYKRSLLIFLAILLICQIVLSSVAISSGFAVDLPPGFVGCIFTGTGTLFPAVWVMPLISDSCIFLLTLWRTRKYLTHTTSTPTIHIFLRDGMLYFFAIFIANLLNTLIYFLAVQDVKPIGASFSQLITSVMISRLVLNLRSLAFNRNSESYPTDHSAGRKQSTFVTRTLHHLGEDLETFDNDDSIASEGYVLHDADYRSRTIINRVAV